MARLARVTAPTETAPVKIVRVIARFEDYAGHFPYHCHILDHEDLGMMAIVEAG